MKKVSYLIMLLSLFIGLNLSGQSRENYGKTLNLGLGIGGYSGYYGYLSHSLPVFHINYEIDVAQSITLAPFVTFYSYRQDHYRETVIPFGGKGSFYLDRILRANSEWDFYLAGSVGVAIVTSTWDNDYTGNRDHYHKPKPLFLDVHIGGEYHFNRRLGAFLDLSSGVSTIGLAFH